MKMSRRNTPKRQLRNLDQRSGQPRRLVVFSLRYIDINQGQSFSDWESDEILSQAMERLRQVSSLTIGEATAQQIIKVYGDFPPSEKTDFSHPRHVPEGVNWASCHIQGKPVIAGFVEDNIFHIVFLDKNHDFWKSELKNT
jgi:hypothetical protein